jgi:hypothetical protein
MNQQLQPTRLFFPAFASVYSSLDQIVETILRFTAGVLLVTHGYGKITDRSARQTWLKVSDFTQVSSGRHCSLRPSSLAVFLSRLVC